MADYSTVVLTFDWGKSLVQQTDLPPGADLVDGGVLISEARWGSDDSDVQDLIRILKFGATPFTVTDDGGYDWGPTLTIWKGQGEEEVYGVDHCGNRNADIHDIRGLIAADNPEQAMEDFFEVVNYDPIKGE